MEELKREANSLHTSTGKSPVPDNNGVLAINNITIPTEKTLCNAEQFVEALKIIANECHMCRITYNGFGPIKFYFEDGSSVGGKRAWMDAGIIHDKEQ